MYLDRIEITGFKSFADKTVIEFDKGVTAVVGPNGSGKSNLSEALKWVLGEQSAKGLRGKKMDDIIFAGSQTRKPVNVAEVSVVLNNEDGFLPLEHSEIRLTRRYNRNGESDCYINKQPCRLKDIVDLLMDSGLGRDSFSMISQGKVETIFYNKPEERRAMFEEVAGVLKYKQRKNQAARKLEQTEDHLNRVADILHEVNQQLTPLHKKRDLALAYQEKKAALSSIDIALMATEIETLNEQWRLAKKERDMLQQNIDAHDQQLVQVATTMTRLREEQTNIDNDNERLQQQFMSLMEQHNQLSQQQATVTERISFSNKSTTEQQQLRFDKERLLTQLRQEQIRVQEKRQQQHEHFRVVQQQLADLKQEEAMLLETNQDTINNMRAVYIDKLQEQTNVQNKLRYLEKDCDTLVERLAHNEQKQQTLQVDLQKAQSLYQQLSQQKDKLQRQTDAAQKAFVAQEQQVVQAQEALRALQAKREQIAASVHQLDAKRHSLQDLTEDYAGYYQGTKEILKKRQQFTGVFGAVAELIDVPAAYTTAIDIALGSSMQHVVVANEQAASIAIDWLKRNRLGRATFLPVSIMKRRPLPEALMAQLQQATGFVGIADQLLHVDQRFSAVVNRLLGQTIVVDNLAHGNQLAKQCQYKYRIVSLEGDVIHAGGSMTGGASKHNQATSMIARKAQLTELTKQCRQQKDALQNIQRQLKEAQQLLEQQQEALKQQQQQGVQQVMAMQQLVHEQQQQSNRVDQLTQALESAQFDKDQYHHLQQTQQKELAEAQQEERRLTKHVAQLQKDLEQCNISEEEKQTRIQTVQQQLQQASARHASAHEQLQQHQIAAQELTKRIHDESAQLNALVSKQGEQAESHEVLTQQLESNKEQLRQLAQRKATIEAQLTALRQEKKACEEQVAQTVATEETLRDTIQKLWAQQSKLEAQIARLDVTIDNNLQHLREEYALTFEAAKEQPPLSLPIKEAAQQVKLLRQELSDIGPVDVTAIEEYEQVLTRSQFLTKQQEDLVQAKEQLWQTMSEIDAEMAKRFGDTFYAIKEQFEQTFPKLFGGGRATLELTDPNNLLETGIDIIAQPPGKRLQNLSLLSGGEKAFTAIALLFAILEVKPVPFCLLDEVEAALDEANVMRYGRYLKSFANNTQFIVITHRKGTMEEADVLYGVTMQESGVSRLASVRFEQTEELLEQS